MSFFRAARSAARSSFRPRTAASYSTALAAPKASSDVVWIVGSIAVFGPTIFYLTTGTKSHAAPHAISHAPAAAHASEPEAEETVEEAKPAVDEPAVEGEPVVEDAPAPVEAQVAAGEPASKPKDVNEVAREDGDEDKGAPVETEKKTDEKEEKAE